MPSHKKIIGSEIHVIHAFTFTDAAGRNSAVVLEEDIGKIAKQSDNDSYYILINTTPTWTQIDSSGFDTLLELSDFPNDFVSDAGKILQVNSGETGLEFGQQLRIPDTPQFAGLKIGTSTPFLDTAGVLTLQDIDALDSISEITIENAIDALPNLVTIQGQNLTVEATSILNQDLTTDANPQFADLTLTGDLNVQGTTTTINTATLEVEDKNIEIGKVATPTDVTADGGGITLKGTTDKTLAWLNATNAWSFNQNIDLLGNNLLTSGGNVLVSNGLINVGNLQLFGNLISTISGDLDLTTQTGGVFKYNDNAFQAGLDASNYLEIGHGGSNSFLNQVGAGGMDFRFAGVTKATFTSAGHLHLLTDVDQKHNLKIKTANNLNDSGIAWQNSGSNFSQTIFRTDIGSNRSDLIFAIGSDANIDLLTNSFKIHGSAANEGRLEILGELQISSGNPGLNKVLTSDANGIANWALPAGGGFSDVGATIILTNINDDVGIGTSNPQAKLEVGGTAGASVGGFASGNLHVTGQSASINANAVITGHNLNGGNKQLWYFGSTSSSNDNIAFINRQNAELHLHTNNLNRFTIQAGGNVGIGLTNPSEKLDVAGNIKFTGDLITSNNVSTRGGGSAYHSVTFLVGTSYIALPFDTVSDLINVELIGGAGGTEWKSLIDQEIKFSFEPQVNRPSGGASESIVVQYETSTDNGVNWIKGEAIFIELKGGDSVVSPLTAALHGKNDRIRFMAQATTAASLEFIAIAAGTITSEQAIIPAYILNIH